MKVESLNKLHKTEVEILKRIVCICEKNNLEYYMVGGTLLGAVRHKGFIPWDDDLDIAMPREDYNSFLNIAQSELGNDFFLQSCFSDRNYGRIFSKVRKNGTLFLEKKFQHLDRHHGIFVDIFPLDHGDKSLAEKTNIKKRVSMVIDSYLQIKRGRLKQRFSIKYLIKLIPYTIFRIIPDIVLIKLRDSLLRGTGNCYINHGSQYGIKKQTFERDKYYPPVKLEFEGDFYNAPKEYDFILRKIYGDNYMQLPPEEKRVTHNPVKLSFDTNGQDEILED